MKTKNVKNSKEITENNATTDTTVQASMDGQRAEADAPAETEEIQNTETVQAPTDHTPEALPTVLMDIAQLRTSPYNPRTTYEEEGIKELAATLRESGLLHPLHVRPKDGYYEIITGERRFHAARLLGWKQIAVYVREATDAQARDMALTEIKDALAAVNGTAGMSVANGTKSGDEQKELTQLMNATKFYIYKSQKIESSDYRSSKKGSHTNNYQVEFDVWYAFSEDEQRNYYYIHEEISCPFKNTYVGVYSKSVSGIAKVCEWFGRQVDVRFEPVLYVRILLEPGRERLL